MLIVPFGCDYQILLAKKGGMNECYHTSFPRKLDHYVKQDFDLLSVDIVSFILLQAQLGIFCVGYK